MEPTRPDKTSLLLDDYPIPFHLLSMEGQLRALQAERRTLCTRRQIAIQHLTRLNLQGSLDEGPDANQYGYPTPRITVKPTVKLTEKQQGKDFLVPPPPSHPPFPPPLNLQPPPPPSTEGINDFRRTSTLLIFCPPFLSLGALFLLRWWQSLQELGSLPSVTG